MLMFRCPALGQVKITNPLYWMILSVSIQLPRFYQWRKQMDGYVKNIGLSLKNSK